MIRSHPLLIAAMLTAGCAHPQTFSLVQSEAIRLPDRISLSADAHGVAYVLGDTMWVANAGDGANRRLVAVGLTRSSNTARPFQALSPHGDRLVFQLGDRDKERAMVATLGESIQLQPLLPDTLESHYMLFQHYAGGGPSWSADGNQLAFLAADRTRDEPLQLFLKDMTTGELRRLHSNGQMHYSVAWSPDGSRLACTMAGEQPGTTVLALLDRAGTPLGDIDTLATEYATDLLWSPDGSRLALFSAQPSTWVYDMTTGSGRTPIEIPRRRFTGWRADGRELLGVRRDGMSTRIVGYSLADGAVRDLSGSDTLFSVLASAAEGEATLLLHTQETGAMPRDLWSSRLGLDGLTGRQRVTNANPGTQSTLPGTSQIVRWHIADGRELEGQILLPRRKGPHPLIVLAYGGRMNAFPSTDYFLEFGIYPLVARGYAVVFPNTRGPASEAAVVGEYGQAQLSDTETLIDSLAGSGMIDSRRVAVLGHSHGASLAYYYATHSRDFCAAVAINGRADWEQQARQGDYFLVSNMGGPPDSLPDLYRRLSPLRSASNTTAPLLAVTGMKDTQIYPFNGRAIVDALTAMGQPAELIEYPREGHMVADPANRAQLWERIFGFLGRYCG